MPIYFTITAFKITNKIIKLTYKALKEIKMNTSRNHYKKQSCVTKILLVGLSDINEINIPIFLNFVSYRI